MPELRVLLREVSTGREGWFADEWPTPPFDLDSAEYMWHDGNYACDCNRALFLARARGEDEPNVKCSDGSIVVVEATWDGESLPDWDETAPA